MNLASHCFPFSYFKGYATTFTKSDRFEESYFGGPCDLKIDGIEYGPSHIHHIATISNSHLGIPGYGVGWRSTFLYGMCFDGCKISYELTSHSALKVTSIEPRKSTAGWPYDRYPPLLPYIPLKMEERKEMPLEEFSDVIMQGINSISDDELVLVVPPNPLMGASLWGPDGDAEGVQIIFKYDTKTGVIKGRNVCT